MKIIGLKEYLLSQGINPDEKTDKYYSARRAHQKLYQKEYRKLRKQKVFRVELALTPKQHRMFLAECKKYGKSMPSLLLLLACSYLEEVFVVPNEEIIRALQIDIRRIGNNLNQVVVKINKSNTVFHSDLWKMQEMVKDLEGAISKIFREPIKLKELLKPIIKEHSGATKVIWEVLKETGYDIKISGTQNNEL